MKGLFFTVGVLSASLVAAEARADYNETNQGDLSNANTAPTVIPVTLGANVVTGTTGTADGSQGTAGVDRDYFTITVPPGDVLSGIQQTAFTSASTGDLAFFGVQHGATFTDPGTTTVSQVLGYVLVGSASLNTNVLPLMGQGIDTATGTTTFGVPIGFTPPLPAGTYTFWIQDGNATSASYQFNFTISQTPPVPAMRGAFIALLAVGLMGFGAFRAGGARRGSSLSAGDVAAG
jgi:hypothetical protein